MRNPLGLLDSSLGEFIVHFILFSAPFLPKCVYRESQHESSSSPAPEPIVPSTPVPPPPYPTSVVLRVVRGGLAYVYEYLLLARASLFLAFHAMQRFFANITRTAP